MSTIASSVYNVMASHVVHTLFHSVSFVQLANFFLVLLQSWGPEDRRLSSVHEPPFGTKNS